MDSSRFSYLYRRYLANQCTESELKEFLELLKDQDEPADLLDPEEFNQQFDQQHQLPDDQSEAIFKRITQPKKHTWKLYTTVAGIAALLLSIICASLFLLKSPESQSKIFTNTTEDILRIALEDGSVILLRPQAVLTQSHAFQSEPFRKVKLQGEAFFIVAKDPSRPFQVQSESETSIQVYGTRFNLKFTPSAKEVVLTEGSLGMKHGTQEVRLNPQEKAYITADNPYIQKTAVDTMKYMAWTEHQLYFTDEPLHEVLKTLKGHYPEQSLQLPKQFQGLRFTGYLPDNNLPESIQILESTFKNYNLVINKN